jgi:uncharacterized membrane protein YgdD (TMEM256/DUF423 family)
MEGVRRVARAILKYFVALLVLAIILQIYFAGEGIFGARADDETIEDAKALDLHRGVGFILTNPVALLLLIVALLAWLPDKRLRIISIVLPFLLFIQMLLAEGGRWVAALHPVNAVLMLALLGYLASRLWRGERETVVGTTTV